MLNYIITRSTADADAPRRTTHVILLIFIVLPRRSFVRLRQLQQWSRSQLSEPTINRICHHTAAAVLLLQTTDHSRRSSWTSSTTATVTWWCTWTAPVPETVRGERVPASACGSMTIMSCEYPSTVTCWDVCCMQ